MGVPKRQERLRGRHAYVDGIRFVMPVDSRNSSAMMAAFPINWEKARALIPPGDVHPFRLWDRGLLVVTRAAVDAQASDLHLKVAHPVTLRINRQLITVDAPLPTEEWLDKVLAHIVPKHLTSSLDKDREVDFSYFVQGVGRNTKSLPRDPCPDST